MAESAGRELPEEPCSLRTDYQRDRDRIVHSKAFRRLKHKTHVFISPEGDHYRTRLTHTMEVAQVSRTVSRALALNEDLTEAIALGHDLGHTPFGHIGEIALSRYLEGGFVHSAQSLRVVETLENSGRGLNLTWEVRDGIANHSSEGSPGTCEGRVVRIADRIAYISSDIDDALRAGIISDEDIPRASVEAFGRTSSERIDAMVHDMVRSSALSGDILVGEDTWALMEELREFLFDRVYIGSVARSEGEKATRVLQSLAEHYLEHTDLLPAEFRPGAGEDEAVRVCDYVAGMTDSYALMKYGELFLPRAWLVE